MTINARFWVLGPSASPVKLTLRPGQRLTWGQCEPTDEGWSAERETWKHMGEYVRAQHESDGSDCDGRLSTWSEGECHLNELRAGNRIDGLRFPAWERGDGGQRDYTAEAMGY